MYSKEQPPYCILRKFLFAAANNFNKIMFDILFFTLKFNMCNKMIITFYHFARQYFLHTF